MNAPARDPYPDALRACALLVVVFGHSRSSWRDRGAPVPEPRR